MLYNELNNQTSAKIIERQSTFVRFVTKSSVEYKVDYIEKFEHLIEELEFIGFDITQDHPLLDYYRQNKIDIYFSTKVIDPTALIAKFGEMVNSEFSGWLDIKDCFNSESNLTSLLKSGYGMLYTGPEALARKIEVVLKGNDIKFKSLPHEAQETPQVKALLMGNNIVVAKDFRIDQVPS